MLFINGPNKDFLVPHSCRATIGNGMSKRSLFYLFLKFVYINFIFSNNIRISGSYGFVVGDLKNYSP